MSEDVKMEVNVSPKSVEKTSKKEAKVTDKVEQKTVKAGGNENDPKPAIAPKEVKAVKPVKVAKSEAPVVSKEPVKRAPTVATKAPRKNPKSMIKYLNK